MKKYKSLILFPLTSHLNDSAPHCPDVALPAVFALTEHFRRHEVGGALDGRGLLRLTELDLGGRPEVRQFHYAAVVNQDIPTLNVPVSIPVQHRKTYF